MSHAPPTTRIPPPSWLKAWYAFLVFMAVVTITTLLLK